MPFHIEAAGTKLLLIVDGKFLYAAGHGRQNGGFRKMFSCVRQSVRMLEWKLWNAQSVCYFHLSWKLVYV